MELSQCNAEISNYSHLIGQILTHKISKMNIIVLELKCELNIDNDYFVNFYVKHQLTGSIEFLDLDFIKKYYL